MSATTLGVGWDIRNPFSTFSKKIDFQIFFRFFEIFLVRASWFAIFDFGLADPPGGCPTRYFTYSWASGEYLRILVCPHWATFRPVLARNLRSAGHQLNTIFDPAASKSVFYEIFKTKRFAPIFYFGVRFGCMKGVFDHKEF